MEKKDNDLRVQRTQRHLKNALVELLLEKPPEHITVKELTRKAEIARGTFYQYYDSVEDMFSSVCQEIENDYEEGLREAINSSDTIMEVVYRIMIHPVYYEEKHAPLLKLLYRKRSNNDMFLDTIKLIQTEISRRFEVSMEPWKAELALSSIVWGHVEVLRRWANDPNAPPLDEMSKFYLELLRNGDVVYWNNVRKKQQK